VRQRQGRSLTEDVYQELRLAILHGQLATGVRLHLGDLAAQRQVSLGVVREAVTRLASERLLDATPQSGFRVRELSAEHLADLTEARCAIEALVLRESIVHGDTQWEANVVAAHHVLSTTPAMANGAITIEWMTAHRAFHHALAAGCPNATLRSTRERLFDEAELYRHWSVRGRGAPRDVAGEHHDLLTAALDRDGERIVMLITQHLQYTARLVTSDAT
jgi:DNA-binding GntR family transcriptional regulator